MVKKYMTTLLALALMICAIPAFAGNVNFSHTFSDTTTTVGLCSSTKNDNVRYFFLTISSGPSNSNVFGCRPNASGVAASTYRKFRGNVSRKQYAYYSKEEKPDLQVYQGDSVTLNGKKDNSSTSTNSLKVTGVFCP